MAEITRLSPENEALFQNWVRANQITDLDHPESRYDYRGFWLSTNGAPHAVGDHFPDTFKQYGHPTFSVESQYSQGPNDGGRWVGEQFVPPGSDLLTTSRRQPPTNAIVEAIKTRIRRNLEAGTAPRP